MGQESKITILLPVLNEGSLIKKCIESILSDVGLNSEIIVIDNGSTDGTISTIRDLAAGFQNIRLLHEDRRGVHYALNKGLLHAKPGWIARMDADDIWLSGRLNLMKSIIQKSNFDKKNIFGTAYIHTTREHDKGIKCNTRFVNFIPNAWSSIFCSPICHPTTFYHSSLFENILPYSSSYPYAEDYDMYWRAIQAGYRIYNIPEFTVLYQLKANPSTLHASANRQKQMHSHDARFLGNLHDLGVKSDQNDASLLRQSIVNIDCSNFNPQIAKNSGYYNVLIDSIFSGFAEMIKRIYCGYPQADVFLNEILEVVIPRYKLCVAKKLSNVTSSA
jgi:glycosyltransferase involved in cell wall biosynthesis